MLKQEYLDTVKATAPVLAAHAETLIKHFYKRMFSHNPEVLPYFNPAHQFEGSQQRALAAAVYAYAANIDNLGALGGAVETIAHKHVALDVRPEHYDIVGENLIESLKEVLGEAATPQVIEAWTAAYGMLAKILIDREEELYQQNERKPGGWRGFRPFVVKNKIKESAEITSFVLAPKDNQAIASFAPGQYLTVRVPTANGSTTMRNYSISNLPGQDHYRISVKHMAKDHPEGVDGYVSTLLHRSISEGDELEVSAPIGNFVFDQEAAQAHQKPLVLLAGGVGITPLLGMLETGLAAKRDIVFIHACRSQGVQAFKADLDSLAAQHSNLKVYYRYSDEQPAGASSSQTHSSHGICDEDFLAEVVPSKDSDYYFCGPKPFMQDVYQALKSWQVPTENIHFEFFGPLADLEAPRTAGKMAS